MFCEKPIYKFLKTKKYNQYATIKDFQNKTAIQIACGKCKKCKITKMLKWKTRLYLEAKEQIENNGNIYFLTLTYNNENIKKIENETNIEIQKMIKRLRKNFKNNKIKYFNVTELGSENGRKHNHILLFSKEDILPIQENGKKINNNYYYQNSNLKWNNGFYSITKIKNDKQNILKTINYILKYLIKNPLNYTFSKNIAKEQIEKIKMNNETYIFNKNILKTPNYKNYETIETKIKNNQNNKLNTNIIKENWTLNKEIEKWKN